MAPTAAAAPEAWKAEAQRLMAAGRHDAAKLILEAGLEAGPHDLAAHALHLRACMDSAPAQSHEALRTADQMRRAAAALGTPEAQLTAGLAAAVAHMLAARDVLRQGPDARQAHAASAAAELQALVAQQPGAAAAQYQLALLLACGGRHDAAVQHTKAALAGAAAAAAAGEGAHGAALVPSLALLALLLSARGEQLAALAVLGKALHAELGGQEGGQAAALGAQELLLLRIRAAVTAAAGDHAGALHVLGSCMRRLGQAGGTSRAQQQAQVWRDMGRIYLARGLQPDAQQCAQQLAKLQPHSAEAHCALGEAAEAAGDGAAAAECYSCALALEPPHLGAMLALGSLHRRSGTPAGLSLARSLLIGALQAAPYHAAAWREAGLLEQAGGDLARAEQQLAQAARLAGSEPVLEYEALPLLPPP